MTKSPVVPAQAGTQDPPLGILVAPAESERVVALAFKERLLLWEREKRLLRLSAPLDQFHLLIYTHSKSS